MSDNDSNGTAGGDTLEALKAEREDMEKTIACVRRMARDFDTMAGQEKLFDPELVAFHLQSKGPHLRRCVWAGVFTPEAFQWHKASTAKMKALGEKTLQDLATVVQAMIRWAEDLEKRESRNVNAPPALGLLARSGYSSEVSSPTVKRAAVEEATGEAEAAGEVEAADSLLTGATLVPAAAAGVAITAAGAVIYGAYKGAIQPGLQAGADASRIREAQLARENYEVDNNPDYQNTLDDENTPLKGWILKPGERRGRDGTIYTHDGQIAVYANGTSALTNEEREAIAGSDDSASRGEDNPFLAGLIPQAGTRQTGINRAITLEVLLVKTTGVGTLDWTPLEIAYIQQTDELPDGIVGHHINSFAKYPDWGGDPRNVQFVRGQTENLKMHGGNFKTSTVGPLIDRAAMIRRATGGQ